MSQWSPRPAPDEPEGLILFDGVCVFCSRWVQFVICRDGGRHQFLPIQTARGRDLAVKLGIDPDAPQTNVVILDGLAWMKSDAALRVLSSLPGFAWVGGLRRIPRPWRDPIYDLIARNRYALFGKTDTCMIPRPDERERFLS